MPRLGRSRPAQAYLFIGQAPRAITLQGTGTLSGSGSLTATPTLLLFGTAPLSGSGSLTATGAFAGAAALSGSGSLTAAGAFAGAAALSGSGTLTAAGVFAGAAALSGSGTLTWSGLRIYKATVLSGSGTLTWSGLRIYKATVLSGSGSLTAAAVFAAGAVLSGSGTLSVPGVTLIYKAVLSGIGTLTVLGTGGTRQASAGPSAPYAYPGTSQISVAPPGTTAWQYLSTLGIVTSLTYSFTFPGGADKLTATVMVPASYRTQLLWPGWQVRVTRGGHVIWTGKMDEPQPSAQGWQVTAVGDGNRGTDFAAIYSGTWPSSIPDDPVNEAITRGLPWLNPGIGTPAGLWLGQAQDSGSITITDLLNLACTRGGLGWYASSQPSGPPAVLSVAPLPTTVNRLLVVTDPVARTLGGDVNTIWLRYEISDGTGSNTSATFGITSVTNAASIAVHGALEAYIDLSSAGVMSAAQAQAVGNYVLAVYQRASWAGPFEVSWGHLLNAGGAPVDPGTDQAGNVVRLILTDFGYGGEVNLSQPVTFIVGAYEWDDFGQKAKVTPYGTLDQSLSGLLSLESTILAPITTQN